MNTTAWWNFAIILVIGIPAIILGLIFSDMKNERKDD